MFLYDQRREFDTTIFALLLAADVYWLIRQRMREFSVINLIV